MAALLLSAAFENPSIDEAYPDYGSARQSQTHGRWYLHFVHAATHKL
jgi:hypothetical protein